MALKGERMSEETKRMNRKYWEQHFTSMITEQYEGKCYIEEVM